MSIPASVISTSSGIGSDNPIQHSIIASNFSSLDVPESTIYTCSHLLSLFKNFWNENALSNYSESQYIAEHHLNYYSYNFCDKTWVKLSSLYETLELEKVESATSYLKLTKPKLTKHLDAIVNYELNEISIKNSEFTSNLSDNIVIEITSSYRSFLANLPYTFLLHNAKFIEFLPYFYRDGIGAFPVPRGSSQAKKKRSSAIPSFIQPFYASDSDASRALTIRADIMEKSETIAFPEFYNNQMPYLSIRNLCIGLFFLKPQCQLTLETVQKNILAPGLARIAAFSLAKDILEYLNHFGIINYGVFNLEKPLLSLQEKVLSQSITILGAGAAGLACAVQLQRFGFKNIRVLEARNRIGGRIFDKSYGTQTAHQGAMIVNGIVNNPFCLMYRQLGLKFQILKHSCPLFDARNGNDIDPETDIKVNKIFDDSLEYVTTRAKLQKSAKNKTDSDLERVIDYFTEAQQLNSTERGVLRFLKANLEFSCGSELKNVSSLNWDQNDQFPQFAGDHCLMSKGFSVCLKEMSDDLNIKYSTVVSKIDYSKNTTYISTNHGEIDSDIVVSTLPLAVYQQKYVKFEPQLPLQKKKAIDRLGSGVIEKVTMKFKKSFWKKKYKGSHFFAGINGCSELRGAFFMYYDLSIEHDDPEQEGILLAMSSGAACQQLISDESDKEILNKALKPLQTLFGSIPKVDEFDVTHWGDDIFAKMSYSYRLL